MPVRRPVSPPVATKMMLVSQRIVSSASEVPRIFGEKPNL
jgi:hypothetical protein